MYQCTQIQQLQLLSVLQAVMMVHDIDSYNHLSMSSDATIVLIMLWHNSREFMGVAIARGAIASFLIDTSGNGLLNITKLQFLIYKCSQNKTTCSYSNYGDVKMH